MSGGGGDGGGQFPTNPWSNAPSPPGGADGSGGGVGGPAGGPSVAGGAAAQDSCSKLTFTARLRNVDVGELAEAANGDVLEVEYRSDPTPNVGVFRPGSTVQLGALAERLGELLPCLQLRRFEAKVLLIDGGNTKVEVRPA